MNDLDLWNVVNIHDKQRVKVTKEPVLSKTCAIFLVHLVFRQVAIERVDIGQAIQLGLALFNDGIVVELGQRLLRGEHVPRPPPDSYILLLTRPGRSNIRLKADSEIAQMWITVIYHLLLVAV